MDQRHGAAGRQTGRPTARQEAEHFIRRQIFTGGYAANTRIPQEEVAQLLGISKIPVREAIVVLECDGIVSNPPNRGAFVLPVTTRDIRAQFELRGYALGMVTRHAAELDDLDIAGDLESIVSRLRSATDPDEFLRLSASFDNIVTKLGGTPKIQLILDRTQRFLPGNFFAQVPDAMPVVSRSLDARLRAMRCRDSDLAMSASIQAGHGQADCLLQVLAPRGILSDE